MRTLQAFDVDTDALSDAFERIADGLRDGGVMVEEVETGHKAIVEAPTEFSLSLRFAASHEYVDAIDAIEYDVDDDFDALWEQFKQTDEELTERLGLGATIHESKDKDTARELWEDDRLTFVGNVPVVLSDDLAGVDE